MADSLSDAIRKLEEVAKSKTGIDADKIRTVIDDLKPQVENLKEKTEDLSKELDKQVREKPWMAVGIVAVVALFIGFLLGRKD